MASTRKKTKAVTNGTAKAQGGQSVSERPTREPLSLSVARRGIKTGADFANLMSSLMTDLIEQRVSPGIGTATCNAGGKLLKVIEMQYKYGTSGKHGGKVLSLAQPAPSEE